MAGLFLDPYHQAFLGIAKSTLILHVSIFKALFSNIYFLITLFVLLLPIKVFHSTSKHLFAF